MEVCNRTSHVLQAQDARQNRWQTETELRSDGFQIQIFWKNRIPDPNPAAKGCSVGAATKVREETITAVYESPVNSQTPEDIQRHNYNETETIREYSRQFFRFYHHNNHNPSASKGSASHSTSSSDRSIVGTSVNC